MYSLQDNEWEYGILFSSVVTVELTLSSDKVTQEAWEEEDHGEIALQPVLYRSVCCIKPVLIPVLKLKTEVFMATFTSLLECPA